jgi:hypothetical protein
MFEFHSNHMHINFHYYFSSRTFYNNIYAFTSAFFEIPWIRCSKLVLVLRSINVFVRRQFGFPESRSNRSQDFLYESCSS